MSNSLLTKKFDVHLTDIFIDSIIGSIINTNYYVTISHVESWANDSSPVIPNDSREHEINLWRGMLGGKKITGNDIYHVVRRINWEANTNYYGYGDKCDCVYANNFYVMTDEYNVYKCISNNTGALSTIKPTYVSVDRTNTEADGYIWKYLYTLNTEERVRFLTSSWMPVSSKTLDDGSLQYRVQQAVVDGEINAVYISNSGFGYTNSNNITITITGDGSSANAIANVNTTSQTINSIIITNPGSGYHFGNVDISSTEGSGATANLIISPQNGHGSNPVEELGASNLMINIRLIDDEDGKLTLQNDYRQVGIIKNPYIYGLSDTLFTNSVFDQTTTVVVSSGSDNYLNDEYVYQGSSLGSSTFSGRLVEWYGSNNTMKLVEVKGNPTAASLVGANSGVSRFLATSEFGELVPYSGSVLYIDNIAPITRNADQTEDIKIVLQF